MSVFKAIFGKLHIENDATSIAIKEASQRNVEAAKKLEEIMADVRQSIEKEGRPYASFR